MGNIITLYSHDGKIPCHEKLKPCSQPGIQTTGVKQSTANKINDF